MFHLHRHNVLCVSLASLCAVSVWFPLHEVHAQTESDVLEEEHVADGEVVVVTGTRGRRNIQETPVATEVISREEIETSGCDELSALLEKSAGMEVVRTFQGSGLRLQGLGPEHVLVLVDGQRVEGRINGLIDLSQFATQGIDRIEVVRGAGSTLYGSDAMGGVVHIRTQPVDDSWGMRARGSVLALDQAWADVAGTDLQWTGFGARGAWSGQIQASHHTQGAFDLDPSDPATTGAEESRTTVSSRVDVDATHDTNISLRAKYTQRDRSAIDSNPSGAVFDRRNMTEHAHVMARTEVAASPRLDLSFGLGHGFLRDQYISDQRASDDLDQDDETREHTTEINLQSHAQLGDEHLMTVGLDGLVQSLSSGRLRTGEDQRVRGAIFVQDEWFVSQAWVLAPGARLDLDQQFGTFATPSLSARWDASETWTLRAGVGRGYRAPSFKEQLLWFQNTGIGYTVSGNPDLTPETSWNANLHAHWNPSRKVSWTAHLYANALQDMIGIVERPGDATTSMRFTYDNVHRAQTVGADLRMQADVWSHAELSVGYTILDARNLSLDRPLDGRARHRVAVGFTQRIAPLDLTLSTRAALASSRPYFSDRDGDGNDEALWLDPTVLVDVQASRPVAENLELFLGANNLLSAGDPFYLPIQPMRVMVGLRLSIAADPSPSSNPQTFAAQTPPLEQPSQTLQNMGE